MPREKEDRVKWTVHLLPSVARIIRTLRDKKMNTLGKVIESRFQKLVKVETIQCHLCQGKGRVNVPRWLGGGTSECSKCKGFGIIYPESK